ncbi:MAG: helix-turn-helix domain-containing protein [Clostridia bacterium]|nr:helix-turn-helix domain-containing protein [Clostridia bacterium]
MNRLKELRINKSMTQDEIGKALGVGKSTVSKYESGAVTLPQKAIEPLCDIFDVTSDMLLGREDVYFSSHERTQPDYVPIPLLGKVHAGLPMFAEENIEEYIPHSASDVRGAEYFYMEVEGDCMTGDFIPEGARVLVKQQKNARNNDIVVVRIEDEVVLRHIKYVGDHIVLVPSNPAYEPMIVTGGDVEIIGRVCEVRFFV